MIRPKRKPANPNPDEHWKIVGREIRAEGGRVVCYVPENTCLSLERDIETLKLIAAAPDMFRKLKDLED